MDNKENKLLHNKKEQEVLLFDDLSPKFLSNNQPNSNKMKIEECIQKNNIFHENLFKDTQSNLDADELTYKNKLKKNDELLKELFDDSVKSNINNGNSLIEIQDKSKHLFSNDNENKCEIFPFLEELSEIDENLRASNKGSKLDNIELNKDILTDRNDNFFKINQNNEKKEIDKNLDIMNFFNKDIKEENFNHVKSNNYNPQDFLSQNQENNKIEICNDGFRLTINNILTKEDCHLKIQDLEKLSIKEDKIDVLQENFKKDYNEKSPSKERKNILVNSFHVYEDKEFNKSNILEINNLNKSLVGKNHNLNFDNSDVSKTCNKETKCNEFNEGLNTNCNDDDENKTNKIKELNKEEPLNISKNLDIKSVINDKKNSFIDPDNKNIFLDANSQKFDNSELDYISHRDNLIMNDSFANSSFDTKKFYKQCSVQNIHPNIMNISNINSINVNNQNNTYDIYKKFPLIEQDNLQITDKSNLYSNINLHNEISNIDKDKTSQINKSEIQTKDNLTNNIEVTETNILLPNNNYIQNYCEHYHNFEEIKIDKKNSQDEIKSKDNLTNNIEVRNTNISLPINNFNENYCEESQTFEEKKIENKNLTDDNFVISQINLNNNKFPIHNSKNKININLDKEIQKPELLKKEDLEIKPFIFNNRLNEIALGITPELAQENKPEKEPLLNEVIVTNKLNDTNINKFNYDESYNFEKYGLQCFSKIEKDESQSIQKLLNPDDELEIKVQIGRKSNIKTNIQTNVIEDIKYEKIPFKHEEIMPLSSNEVKSSNLEDIKCETKPFNEEKMPLSSNEIKFSNLDDIESETKLLNEEIIRSKSYQIKNSNNEDIKDETKPFKQEKIIRSSSNEIKHSNIESPSKSKGNTEIINRNQFSFFNQFPEQNYVNNSYFKGIELNREKENDSAKIVNIFESIDFNMTLSRNIESPSFPKLKGNNTENSNTLKFNTLENNNFEMSGRQSDINLLSNCQAFEQTFKPSKLFKDFSKTNDEKALELIEEKSSLILKKDKDSSNEFHLIDHNQENEANNNIENNKHLNSTPINLEEKNFATIKTYSNSPDKNSVNVIDYDTILLNLQNSEKESEHMNESMGRSLERYRYKEPESKVDDIKNNKLNDLIDKIVIDNNLPLVNENKGFVEKIQEKKEFVYSNFSEKFYGKLIIGEENENNIKQKKDLILYDKFFTLLCDSNSEVRYNKISNYYSFTDQFLITELEKIFKNVTNEEISNMLNILENFNINDKEKSITYWSKHKIEEIGYFTGLTEYDIHLKKIFEDCVKFLILKADGNNFYRSFMFALFENHILNENLLEIMRIVFDFSTIIDNKLKNNNVIIDKALSLRIFNLIMDSLLKNNSRSAYLILCKAIIMFPNFELGLVKYMRLVLAKFIENNKEIIYKEENQSIFEIFKQNAYKKDNLFNLTGFIDENILSMNYEAGPLIYFLSPILFNINLELYIIEGSLNNYPNNVRFLKKNYNSQSKDSTEKLTLIYRKTHFDVVYTKYWYNSYKQVIDIISDTDKTFSKTRIISTDSLVCELCQKQTVFIKFIDPLYAPTCRECLTSIVKNRMIQRAKNYIAENYNNIEFYCRPIDLNEDKILYNEDFLILMEKTISQYFVSILEILCECCTKEYDTKEFNTLVCFCKVCKNCLMKKLKLATDDLVIFNSFELKFVKLKTVTCFCYNEFQYTKAINTFTEEEMIEYVKSSNERLSQQVQGFCMECESSFPKQKETTSQIKYFTVKILDNNIKTTSNHIICLSCFKNHKSIKDNAGNLISSLHCNLCDIIHIIDTKLWDNKSVNQKKCLCDCTIF